MCRQGDDAAPRQVQVRGEVRRHGMSWRSPRSSALRLYLLLALAMVVTYFSLPGLHMVLWASLGLSSVVAILVGVRRNRPEQPLPWYLLAGAVGTFAAGDFTYNVLTLVLHQDNPFPSVADGF